MQKISEKIQEILGQNCRAIYIARPKFFHETLVIVIDKYPFSSVQKIKYQLQNISYILLTEKEINDSSDVFPLHFLSLQQTGKNIFGTDIFANISIKNSDIRRKLEYDFRNKNIYLRQEAINIPSVQIIENILPELFPAFCSLAKFLGIHLFFKTYSTDEYKKLLKEIEKNIKNTENIKNSDIKYFSIFYKIIDENNENWTDDEALDILKQTSIALEHIADVVNDL